VRIRLRCSARLGYRRDFAWDSTPGMSVDPSRAFTSHKGKEKEVSKAQGPIPPSITPVSEEIAHRVMRHFISAQLYTTGFTSASVPVLDEIERNVLHCMWVSVCVGSKLMQSLPGQTLWRCIVWHAIMPTFRIAPRPTLKTCFKHALILVSILRNSSDLRAKSVAQEVESTSRTKIDWQWSDLPFSP
jgi:hypothetical protein